MAALGLYGALPPFTHAQSGSYSGRLIDAHGHIDAWVYSDYNDLMRLYDAAEVDGCWLFSNPWGLGTDAWAAHSERVVPFLAEGYYNTLHADSAYVDHQTLEYLLARRVVQGLGEIILRHSPFQLGAAGGGASGGATHVPADEPHLIQTYRLAGRYGMPATVHQERFFSTELDRALRAAPETTFVWAHAGHGPAGVVGELIARHPHLHADLSARTPWIGPRTVLMREDGRLEPAWQRLLERFPDRFLIGLDPFAPAHYRAEYLRMMAEYYRRLLGNLPLEVAEMIAYRNAERLAPFTPAPRPRPGSHISGRHIPV